MATVNTDPIYSRVGDVSSNTANTPIAMSPTLTAATGDYTGANGNNRVVFTADTVNGSYVQRLRFKALGTNVATVARIYFNNGSPNSVANNNSLFGECSLPATTAIQTAATVDIDYPINVALNPGFQILVGLGTTVAAGWEVVPIAGKY